MRIRTMEKITYGELKALFLQHEGTRPEKHLTGCIVFTENSFEKPYPLESRSYVVSSNNKAYAGHLHSDGHGDGPTDCPGGTVLGNFVGPFAVQHGSMSHTEIHFRALVLRLAVKGLILRVKYFFPLDTDQAVYARGGDVGADVFDLDAPDFPGEGEQEEVESRKKPGRTCVAAPPPWRKASRPRPWRTPSAGAGRRAGPGTPSCVHGRNYLEKDRAGEALMDAAAAIAETDPVEIGSYRGFGITVQMRQSRSPGAGGLSTSPCLPVCPRLWPRSARSRQGNAS